MRREEKTRREKRNVQKEGEPFQPTQPKPSQPKPMAANDRPKKRHKAHAQLFSVRDLEELREELRSREREMDGSLHEGVVPTEYVLCVCSEAGKERV